MAHIPSLEDVFLETNEWFSFLRIHDHLSGILRKWSGPILQMNISDFLLVLERKTALQITLQNLNGTLQPYLNKFPVSR